MTRHQLRAFLQVWYCGCGSPESASKTLLFLLSRLPTYAHRDELRALMPSEGLQFLMLYTLDHFGLIEHGTSIMGSWLTDKGKAVRAALEAESADEFNTLHSGNFCIHGFNEDESCEECQ